MYGGRRRQYLKGLTFFSFRRANNNLWETSFLVLFSILLELVDARVPIGRAKKQQLNGQLQQQVFTQFYAWICNESKKSAIFAFLIHLLPEASDCIR